MFSIITITDSCPDGKKKGCISGRAAGSAKNPGLVEIKELSLCFGRGRMGKRIDQKEGLE
ncbi:hypothetical protein [Dehalobacterium formicoaceticum]|uniref:hypothetical protein n=1 Tax=Dehalobacterium formicoaceticum TaxID=51515 RepID=UPI000B7F961F|nr:hypothetical protein [Dehalobacterium formicoaceticum]